MSDVRLLVPVNIEALVVGTDSRTEWVDLKPDFREVYRRDQVLGQQLEKSPFSPSTGLHEPGVHLHWALPDGLTHGVTQNNGGRPKFPCTPNRWLVARFWDQSEQNQKLDLRYKAWIVESGTVTTDTSAAVWPTLQSAKLEKREDYSVFVGKQWELSQWPGERSAPSVDITAIGYGDPAFAAYYPACKGILGFHDTEVTDLQAATLTYVVVGWHADPSNDPLHTPLTDKTSDDPVTTLDKFLGDKQWTYPGFAETVEKVKQEKELAADRQEAAEMRARLQDAQNKDETIDNSSAIAELEKKIAAIDGQDQARAPEIAGLQHTLPDRLLCHGVITGIQWKDTIDSGVPRGKPCSVSIGDTTVEALAALFEEALGDELEQLLSVFQYDLLDELEKPGGESIVAHKVHERSYGRLARGIRWDLLQETHPAFGGSPEDRNPPMEDRAPPIPGDVRLLLEQLNTRQREINQLKRQQDSLRSELYATWYKKVLDAQGQKKYEQTLNQRITELRQEIERVTTKIVELEVETEKRPKGTEWEEIQRQLKTFLPGWELQQFDEPEFWRTNDPVVLMAGKAFQRSARHGEDGRFRSDGQLLCRLSGQEITGIKMKIPHAKDKQDVVFGPADLDQWCTPFASLGDRLVPAEVNDLFREALLLTLDAKRARAIVTQAYEKNESGLAKEHTADIETYSGQLLDVYLKKVWQDARDPDVETPKLRYPETDKVDQASFELIGTFPSPIVMNRWEENPWLPLFLQWQVSWEPAYVDTARALASWELTGQGTSFERTGTDRGQQDIYSGTTLLTPSATLQFSDRLRQYNLTHDNDTLRTFQTAVSSMPVLCQSLGGLTDQLLMRKGHLELRPLEPGSGEEGPQFSAIYQAVKDVDWLAPLTDKQLLPIRAGHLKLEKLWIIDAFGQFLKLEELEPQEKQREGTLFNPLLPRRLRSPGGSVRLEPRLAQPARLTIEWPSAERWGVADETDHPRQAEEEFNPICGWIVPNFLDEGFMIYNAKGYALGSLQKVLRKSWREGVGGLQPELESFHWVDIPGSQAFFFGLPPEKISDPLGEKANPHLRAFVKGLLSLTEGSGQAFSDLLDRIDEALSASSGVGSSHNPNLTLLIGRPLALVRAALRLEVDGRLACAQGWDDTPSPTGRLEHLKVPVRLGDRRKWQDVWLGDDGLAGFFLKGQDKRQGNTIDYTRFYPAFGLSGRADDTYNTYNHTPQLSLAEPLDLTLLMDPTRGVCVTSGILPRTIFRLPYGDTTETLENKQVVFYTGPVVSPESEQEVRMPQPSDIYGQWSWTHHPEVKVWGEPLDVVDVQKEQGRFSDTPLQIAEGWLKLITAPLAVRVFTVKGKNPVEQEKQPESGGEPSIPERFEVIAGEQIILTWAVSGAEKIELKEGETSLFESHRHPLPTQYAIQVEQTTTFTLVATGRVKKSSEKNEPELEIASKTITIIVKET